MARYLFVIRNDLLNRDILHTSCFITTIHIKIIYIVYFEELIL